MHPPTRQFLVPLTVVVLAVAVLVAPACSKEARESAEFAAFYSMLGMELGQTEQRGYPELAAQLGPAHTDARKRAAVVAGFHKLVDDIEAVVKRHAPDDPSDHKGYQAAMLMVEQRRAAVADLAKAWESVKEPTDDPQAPIRFGQAWLKAGLDFQNKVGELSQRVFGAAADKAQEGALQQLEKVGEPQP